MMKEYIITDDFLDELTKKFAYAQGQLKELVRCKDCKHRIVNEHSGKLGYFQLNAMCDLDTDDPFELGRNAFDDNWFCADGERKE